MVSEVIDEPTNDVLSSTCAHGPVLEQSAKFSQLRYQGNLLQSDDCLDLPQEELNNYLLSQEPLD